MLAREVVLALPQRPLARLDLEPLRRDIDAVVGIPLLKVFFIVDQPWWEDNRPSNRFAADLPTREIYYWKSKDKSKGVLMVYTDRPALQFWTDYLHAPADDATTAATTEPRRRARDRVVRQEKAATWLLGEDGARSEAPSCRTAGSGNGSCNTRETTSTTTSPRIGSSRAACVTGARSRTTARCTSGGRARSHGRSCRA